jgi:hypothetical protein
VNKIGIENFRAACINRRALAITWAPSAMASIDEQQCRILTIDDGQVIHPR